jgi:hypothetical protein
VLVRCSAALLLLTSTALAQSVPGTADDPLASLTMLPEVVDAPLYPGLVLRGGEPADSMVLLDGFELPTTFHGETGLRSLLIPGTSSTQIRRVVFGNGRASGFVMLEPKAPGLGKTTWLSSSDIGFRDSYSRPPRTWNGRRVPFGNGALRAAYGLDRGVYIDAFLHLRRGTTSSEQSLTYVASGFDVLVGRIVFRSKHRRGSWTVNAAASTMTDVNRTSIDGRVEVSHSGPAAGLRQVTWFLGVDSENSRYDLDRIYWTPDLGAWGTVTARLSSNIVARGGVRMDAFLRTHDVAIQPRASIMARFGERELELEAGAFRRPAEKIFELPLDLHPERTTQLSARFTQGWSKGRNAAIASLTGFYADRTHLITRDSIGVLGNNGFATANGVELHAVGTRHPWIGLVGLSLSSSTRRDYFRARQRPSDFDQPMRFDSVIVYRAKRWQVSARFSLSSGLPYTPVVESTYDSDADAYVPVFGFTNSERLPWMHSLDIRGDIKLGKHWTAFADIRNAYAASTALGYQYSYDYKTRLETTLPILPYVGLRGDF